MKRALVFGENVYLRPIELADIDRGWLDWINDRAVNQHLASTLPVSRESLERYWVASQPPSAAMFAVCLTSDDTYIGNARLSDIDWVSRKCKYGRIIGDARYRGRGYGTEALILLLRYGFHNLGLNRIATSVVAENDASLGSNDKVGMSREGILREEIWRDGRYYDAVYVAMLRTDFDRLHGTPAEWQARDKKTLLLLASGPRSAD